MLAVALSTGLVSLLQSPGWIKTTSVVGDRDVTHLQICKRRLVLVANLNRLRFKFLEGLSESAVESRVTLLKEVVGITLWRSRLKKLQVELKDAEAVAKLFGICRRPVITRDVFGHVLKRLPSNLVHLLAVWHCQQFCSVPGKSLSRTARSVIKCVADA